MTVTNVYVFSNIGEWLIEDSKKKYNHKFHGESSFWKIWKNQKIKTVINFMLQHQDLF